MKEAPYWRPKILYSTIQNLVTTATLHLSLVYPATKHGGRMDTCQIKLTILRRNLMHEMLLKQQQLC